MAGHRRAEATPFFERLCPAIHVLFFDDQKTWMPGIKPGTKKRGGTT
jgi:hypothetical protein